MSSPFALAPDVYALNHGSFGAVTQTVRAAQTALRDRMEHDTMAFFTKDYLPGLDRARTALANFLGARPDDLVFVRNATEGVATVLASLPLEPDDRILVNDHEYAACVKACRRKAPVDTVELSLPTTPQEVEDKLVAAIEREPRTRVVLLSHVTSPTGLIFPLEGLLDRLAGRPITLLVDGAHAPGMLDLDLDRLRRKGLKFYTANLHKWLCGLKGSGFLWIAPAEHDRLRPLVTSHGEGAVWPDRSPLHTRFDWTGTDDPSPFLLVPEVLHAFGSLHPDGPDGVRKANRKLVLEARSVLIEGLGRPPVCPPEMIGSLAAVSLPDAPNANTPHALGMGSLQSHLHERGFRVPISHWPEPPKRLLRVSAHRYNKLDQYHALLEALQAALSEGL